MRLDGENFLSHLVQIVVSASPDLRLCLSRRNFRISSTVFSDELLPHEGHFDISFCGVFILNVHVVNWYLIVKLCHSE